MKIMKYFSAAIVLSFLFINQAAAATTVLPSDEEVDKLTELGCVDKFAVINETNELEVYFKDNSDQQDMILGCAVKSGAIKFWMLPFFIKYILQWVINLAGLISILMILVGAYYYIYGGITDDKTKGKNVILYAIGGLILTSIAWFLVNVVLLAITN